ncbi:MAG TPA: NADH-quinone oxidoreductase subunit C [Spirochaetota bacterium]
MKRISSRNGRPLFLAQVPELSISEFRSEILDGCVHGERVIQFFGLRGNHSIKLFAVLANDENSSLHSLSTQLAEGESFPSLANDVPSLHIYEREIFEEFGIIPENHPWLKPVRYPHDRADQKTIKENYPFFSMEGDEIHEVAVGPVHAGVIEPGHFRFMCDGENLHHLEIQLGYQHRGVENLFLQGDILSKTVLSESIAGDTTIGHAYAYARGMEGLSGIEISRRAMAVRGIALELERIGIHLGDLSALSGDIAYLSGNSFFGAMRTLVINTSQSLCGNRFGRGLIFPGGVYFDIDDRLAAKMRNTLTDVSERTTLVCDALFSDPGVLSRFEKTGVVDSKTAQDLGLTGPAARASGLRRDTRADQPFGIYRYFPVYARTMESGDVFARAYMRYLEIQQSIDLIIEILDNYPEVTDLAVPLKPLKPDSIITSLIEGWRGEIVHTVITDHNGKVIRYKIKDPSLHNWNGLAYAVRGNGISDFPLCNKSFNLSYCGFDL